MITARSYSPKLRGVKGIVRPDLPQMFSAKASTTCSDVVSLPNSEWEAIDGEDREYIGHFCGEVRGGVKDATESTKCLGFRLWNFDLNQCTLSQAKYRSLNPKRHGLE